jgi:hypothetical protein
MTSRLNHRALIKGVLASEHPDKEAIAIIGGMAGVIASHLGPHATAKMLRTCADLTEGFDPDRPSSIIEDLCTLMQEPRQ